MIRPLRRRHARFVLTLALTLPVLLTAALLARPDEQLARMALPSSLLATHDVQPLPLHDLGQPSSSPGAVALPGGIGVLRAARLAKGPLDDSSLDLEFGDLPASPSLLLYWAPMASLSITVDDVVLPDDAVLLGAPRPRSAGRFPLPAAALAGEGTLFVYSLGHRKLLGAPLVLSSKLLESLATDHGAQR